jgi:hypothetical protein
VRELRWRAQGRRPPEQPCARVGRRIDRAVDRAEVELRWAGDLVRAASPSQPAALARPRGVVGLIVTVRDQVAREAKDHISAGL